MTTQEIRKAYIDFFVKKKHVQIPRAQLVPQDDPTTLFTGSGMQPLLPYLLGEEHPEGNKLVDSQTCLRAQDIEEVGNNRHTTFFEMLGNWSLGDYFKEEQLPWFFEFLTETVGLDADKLYVTCFIGDKKHGIPKDEDSGRIWERLFRSKKINAKEVEIGSEESGYKKGMQEGRIFYYDASKNWWCRAGKIDDMPAGEPGGPDSEVFYDFGTEHDERYGKNCHPNCDCGRFMEIGNSVFMEYIKTKAGFDKLPKQNVDFGGGLERIAAAKLDNPDVFKISLLWPIIEKLEELSGKKYDSHKNNMRVIADHLRGVVFLAVDGVAPSNKEQGYVARRLIRRAIRYAFELGIEQGLCEQITPVIVDLYKNDFPKVAKAEKRVIETLVREERLFRQTLRKGLREFEKIVLTTSLGDGDNFRNDFAKRLTGQMLFRLYDTYGFPVELTKEEAFKRGIDVTKDANEQFEKLMKEQRERSQTATKGVFKGGLVDHSDETKKLHTATHLMYEALRQVLGGHVVQRGSNVSAERTRFDFSHPEKVPRQKLDEVEKIVNEQIETDLKVEWKEYPTKEALKMGAKGAFGDKYGDKVKVYTMGEPGKKPFSIEICGGPHVEHTGVLAEGGKKFKIIKEEASSSGVRRVKAVLA
ncbi:MAG TPA: alanine--tRNA ligase [Candidatus Saccharimonadales bacterium]|nr:alanine--tRNA ligase [Candidatus Saccharimonadales bacterium]